MLRTRMLVLPIAMLAGCDALNSKPAEEAAAPTQPAPPPLPPAPPAPIPVALATGTPTGPEVSFADNGAGGYALKTYPAPGGYSVVFPLPDRAEPSVVHVTLQVTKGALGAVVTELGDSNKWVSAETGVAVGATTIDIDMPTLSPARWLLLRNGSPDGASEAVIQSIEVRPKG